MLSQKVRDVFQKIQTMNLDELDELAGWLFARFYDDCEDEVDDNVPNWSRMIWNASKSYLSETDKEYKKQVEGQVKVMFVDAATPQGR